MKSKQTLFLTHLPISSTRTHGGLIWVGLFSSLVLASQVNAQTTASAGAATTLANGTLASGSTSGTFLDFGQAASWNNGLPTSSTEAIFSGGRLGTTTNISANKLTLGSYTNLYGGSYQGNLTADTIITDTKTITLGSGGLSTGSTGYSRIGPNLIIDVGATDQTWTVASGRSLNYQGRHSGSATITLDGAGTLWKRDASSSGFNGVWNVTNGTLRVENRFGIGNTSASVALSNNSTLRISTASTDFDRNLSIGSGGGQLNVSVSGVVFTGAISGSNTLTLVRAGNQSFTLGSNMTDHVGAIAIDRTAFGTTMNFGEVSFQAQVSMTLGLNGIVDGVDTSGGSSSSLIRGGSGSNNVSVNLANALFNIDLSGANIADGNQWRLFDATNLDEAYGAGFSVASNLGAFTEFEDIWTQIDGNNTWTFTESNGVLDLTVIPEPNSALLAGLGLLALLRRRRA